MKVTHTLTLCFTLLLTAVQTGANLLSTDPCDSLIKTVKGDVKLSDPSAIPKDEVQKLCRQFNLQKGLLKKVCSKDESIKTIKGIEGICTGASNDGSKKTDDGSKTTDGVSKKPDGVSKKPDNVSKKPDGVSKKPDNVSKKPDSVSKKPDSVSKKPDGVSKKPDGVSKKPDSVSKKPDGVSKKPDGVNKKPDSVSKKPDGVSKKPDGVSKKPDGGSTTKPNVILVIGDDIGHYNVGYNGNQEAKTPHIDNLAVSGARFNRMYAYCWCSPSRASIMSGRLPVHMYEMAGPQASAKDGLPVAVTTLAEKMKAAGYSTVQAGKWHLGLATMSRMPIHRGFDSSLGFLGGAENHFNQSVCSDHLCLRAFGGPAKHLPGIDHGLFDLWHDETAGTVAETGADKGWGDDRWTDHVIEAINATTEDSKPLFAWLSLASAHSPLQATKEALAPFPADMYHDRRLYNGLMSTLDSNIGRLVAALKAKGMWDNTVLFFVSDNGGPIYFNNPTFTQQQNLQTGGGANNYPLTGGKISVLEGGVRVVSFAAGGALPTQARGQTYQQMFAIADIHATICDLGGAKLPDTRGVAAGIPPVDGVSMLPLLNSGPSGMPVRDVLPLALNVTAGSNAPAAGALVAWGSALIAGDLKIIVGDQHFYVTPNKTFPTEDYAYVWDDAHKLKCGTTGCLFNLTADEGEQHNLAASRPDLLASMHARLAQELAKKYERPTGDTRKLEMLLELRKRDGFIGPYAED